MRDFSAYLVSLRRYIAGDLTFEQLYDHLLDAEYDSSLSSDDRDTLAEVRAVAMEVAEETADKFELEAAIVTLLQTTAGSLLCGAGHVDMSSGVQGIWYIYAWEAADTVRSDLAVPAAAESKPTPALIDATVLTGKPKHSKRMSLAA